MQAIAAQEQTGLAKQASLEDLLEAFLAAQDVATSLKRDIPALTQAIRRLARGDWQRSAAVHAHQGGRAGLHGEPAG